MFRRQITVGYPNRALAAAISSGLSSRVRKAALKLGGTAMASTSGSSEKPGEHDDRKPGSYQSAAEVVGKSAEHPDREKTGLCCRESCRESDDATAGKPSKTRDANFIFPSGAEAPIIPAVYRSAETLRYLRSIALFYGLPTISLPEFAARLWRLSGCVPRPPANSRPTMQRRSARNAGPSVRTQRGNGCDAGILQQNAANFFGAGAGSANIDPGIKGASGRFAVKSWNLIEVVNELCPAAGESETMRGVFPSRSRSASMAAHWVNSATQV